MWIKVDGFNISMGIGYADRDATYLTLRGYGLLLVAVGAALWVFSKVPVVMIILGVVILIAHDQIA